MATCCQLVALELAEVQVFQLEVPGAARACRLAALASAREGRQLARVVVPPLPRDSKLGEASAIRTQTQLSRRLQVGRKLMRRLGLHAHPDQSLQLLAEQKKAMGRSPEVD
mmetsp:Transcript_3172/g.6108  ORF Transcript_3172/g.6108 Transcript_3172/m.6108 type:complete len:111 (+) Transcript_3172:1091-1423(+)